MPDDKDVKSSEADAAFSPFLGMKPKKPETIAGKPKRQRKTKPSPPPLSVIPMTTTEAPGIDSELAAMAVRVKKMTRKQAGRKGGRPTRRQQQQAGVITPPVPVDDIDEMTEEEAEACLQRELSPAHLALKMTRALMEMVAAGGKSGSDAARLLDILQKKWAPQRKRAVEVALQLA